MAGKHESRPEIVIDTKFTSVTKAGRYREHSLSSGYLYQMYAYLMSQADAEIDNPSEGLMLHPVVAGQFDEEFVIQGRRIRFATVDLSSPAKELVNDFLDLICPSSQGAADSTLPPWRRPAHWPSDPL